MLLRSHPAYLAELGLVDSCGWELDTFLRGERDALSVIFARDSGLIDHFYQHSPTLKPYSLLVRAALKKIAGDLPEGKVLRVLEVGAGTGSLTAHLLPVLPAERTEYMFTDLSMAFANNAKSRFSEYSFVQYGTLDMERDPVEQGFEPHSFDIILASDAVHATADLCRTLGNLSAVEQIVSKQVANVLGIPSGKLDAGQPLSAVGFDSLMAVELSVGLETSLNVAVPKMILLQPGLCVSELVNVVDGDIDTPAGNVPFTPAARSTPIEAAT